MGHEITERADGTAEAAYAMLPAWHGLGTVLDHPMSSAEAMAAAKLDWRVDQIPLFGVVNPQTVEMPPRAGDWVRDMEDATGEEPIPGEGEGVAAQRGDGDGVRRGRVEHVAGDWAAVGGAAGDPTASVFWRDRDTNGDPFIRPAEVRPANSIAQLNPRLTFDGLDQCVPVPGMVLNVRSDNRLALGVVSTQYKPLQNVDAFRFMDSLADAGTVEYEAVGSLKGGRHVWLLCRMPGAFDVAPSDPQHKYVLLLTSHDASRSVVVLPTNVRVVCMNTVRAALKEAGENDVTRINHTGDMLQKIEFAREAIAALDTRFAAHFDLCKSLAARDVTAEQLRQYVDACFPTPDPDDVLPPRILKVRERVVQLFEDPRTNALPGIRGTAWAAFNAVTQWYDHERVVRGATTADKCERRFTSAMIDGTAGDKFAAFQRALAMFLGFATPVEPAADASDRDQDNA